MSILPGTGLGADVVGRYSHHARALHHSKGRALHRVTPGFCIATIAGSGVDDGSV